MYEFPIVRHARGIKRRSMFRPVRRAGVLRLVPGTDIVLVAALKALTTELVPVTINSGFVKISLGPISMAIVVTLGGTAFDNQVFAFESRRRARRTTCLVGGRCCDVMRGPDRRNVSTRPAPPRRTTGTSKRMWPWPASWRHRPKHVAAAQGCRRGRRSSDAGLGVSQLRQAGSRH